MLTHFDFPEFLTTPVGLQPARLERLGRFVVLAGPNGAGKSRYLKLLLRSGAMVQNAKNRSQQLQPQIVNLTNQLARLSPGDPAFRAAAERHDALMKDAGEWDSIIKWADANGVDAPPQKIIDLSYPATVEPDNPDSLTVSALTSSAEGTRAGGFSSALKGLHVYFDDVARSLHDSRHPDTKELQTIKDRLADAEAFNDIIAVLLGGRIEPLIGTDGRPVANFRARRFVPAELSKGERVLAAWAVILHRQRSWLRDAIVVVDEPESHLHPDVAVKALTNLLDDAILGPSGQVWIGTHSVPLVAHLGLESLFFVHGGNLSFSGNNASRVVDGLLGGTSGRERLAKFLGDASELAFDSFVAQCLLPARTAHPKEDDPQMRQVLDATANRTLRVLDYAAGRGRLAAALRANGANSKAIYFAYNHPDHTSPAERDECVQHLRALNQPAEEEYYVETLERLRLTGLAKLDRVVLCNVLHEIPATEWVQTAKQITAVLADAGELLVFEDQLPAVGELPSAHGYLVLDEVSLRELFAGHPGIQSLPTELNGRLTGFSIPRAAIGAITPTTIVAALESIQRTAVEQITRTRAASKPSFQDGRRHAHFVTLFANATLALRAFK